MAESELPLLYTDAPRRWAVAGKPGEKAGVTATPFSKPEVTDGLALFESAAPAGDGYARWKAEVDAAKRAFEHRWGVPLGRRVRLQLRGEPREREGQLRLMEEAGSGTLRLSLDGHVFTMTQIESVSRL